MQLKNIDIGVLALQGSRLSLGHCRPVTKGLHSGLELHLGVGKYLSEPAKSTKLSLPRVTFWVCKLVASMMTLMMR